MPSYFKISNINGRFDHVEGHSQAIARIREIEGEPGLTEAEAVKDYGWTITRISDDEARAVGLG